MIFLFGYLIKKECSLIIKTLITRSRLQLNAVAHQTISKNRKSMNKDYLKMIER